MTETELPLYLAHVDASQELDVLGRMPVGGDGDESEFDFLPRNEWEITEEQAAYAFGDPQSAAQPDAPNPPTAPAPTAIHGDYPLFILGAEGATRLDTDATFDDLVIGAAQREVERRLSALEQAFAQHQADPNAHHLSRTTVLGAAGAVRALAGATSADDAAAALPKVPLDVPAAVKCWMDGTNLVCSLRFLTADGAPRVATKTTKPKGETVLGAAQRLVKETARAALRAQEKLVTSPERRSLWQRISGSPIMRSYAAAAGWV